MKIVNTVKKYAKPIAGVVAGGVILIGSAVMALKKDADDYPTVEMDDNYDVGDEVEETPEESTDEPE